MVTATTLQELAQDVSAESLSTQLKLDRAWRYHTEATTSLRMSWCYLELMRIHNPLNTYIGERIHNVNLWIREIKRILDYEVDRLSNLAIKISNHAAAAEVAAEQGNSLLLRDEWLAAYRAAGRADQLVESVELLRAHTSETRYMIEIHQPLNVIPAVADIVQASTVDPPWLEPEHQQRQEYNNSALRFMYGDREEG